MKHLRHTPIVLMLMALLLLCSCSNKGAHMPKHRKKRHCNCPTFSMNRWDNRVDKNTLVYND